MNPESFLKFGELGILALVLFGVWRLADKFMGIAADRVSRTMDRIDTTFEGIREAHMALVDKVDLSSKETRHNLRGDIVNVQAHFQAEIDDARRDFSRRFDDIIGHVKR